jgi:nucleotide-binding universal stress UspA family protein
VFGIPTTAPELRYAFVEYVDANRDSEVHMFKSIIVTLDGSVAAEQALAAASVIGRKSEATIHLVHVLDVFSKPDYTRDMPSFEYWNGGALGAAQKYLRTTAERMQAGHALRVTQSLLQGEIVPNLLDEADRVSADLVIMTTHGIGGTSAGWIGSVADRMVRLSKRPILLIRPHRPQPLAFTHILVTLDGSSTAEEVLVPAAKLAALHGARVTLLTVARPHIAPVSVYAHVGTPATVAEPSLCYRPDPADVDYLALTATSLKEYDVEVETQVVVTHSSAASTVLRYTDLGGVDCIAIATHGRGRVARRLLGSVADKVLRNASCAVLMCAPGDAKP